MAASTLISVPRDSWAALLEHLLQNDVEQVAVLFASYDRNNGAALSLDAIDYTVCGPEDFTIQSDVHVSLTDEAQARLIKMAWDRRAAFIELHSHVGNPATIRFSPSDLSGFQEFVPHVRWRLRGSPYAAIVVAEGGFDALVWRGDSSEATALTALRVGRDKLMPSNQTIQRLRTSTWR